MEDQASDRAHRIGQRKDVFVHSLICTATLEERIDELLDSKRELAEKVVAGRADDWLGELDLDAIRAAVALSPTLGRGGGMTTLSDGRPIFVEGDGERIGRGPWARWLATSVVPDEGSPRAERGRTLARIGPRPQRHGCARGDHGARDRVSRRREYRVSLAADAVPPRVWAAVVGSPRGRALFDTAAAGREQSLQLEHVMTVDWEEPLIPRHPSRATLVHVPRRRSQRAPASTLPRWPT